MEEATSKVEKRLWKGKTLDGEKRFERGGEGVLFDANRAVKTGASSASDRLAVASGRRCAERDARSISNGRVKSSRITENDKDYAVFDVDADRKYTVKITLITRRLFGPPLPRASGVRRRLCSIAWSVLFAVYTNASQFV